MKKRFLLLPLIVCLGLSLAQADDSPEIRNTTLRPNLQGRIAQPLRYHPEGADFVIRNGGEFFNRSLYGANDAFRVDGGDKPEFSLYLPGRDGNLRLGLRTEAGAIWLHNAADITTRYRPGELQYEIADPLLGPQGRLRVAAVAYAVTQGLGLQISGSNLPAGAELLIAFGPGNGQKGQRGGDIGSERVPISEFFQFSPDYARSTQYSVDAHGFVATARHATISATVNGGAQTAGANNVNPAGAGLARPGRSNGADAAGAAMYWRLADAGLWNKPAPLLASAVGDAPAVAIGTLPIGARTIDLALQVIAVQPPKAQAGMMPAPPSLLPRLAPTDLPRRFAEAREHVTQVRNRVRIDTPDPWLNAAMGALNVAADAVWDEEQHAIMHGAIAWRMKLLGWRGPYALDALGWHERARDNFDVWTERQDTSAIPASPPPADPKANLARNEPGLHSNGAMSKSHYDMNLVFIDALLRHLLWTGDLAYAREVWPVLERHLAWERRLFRREFGPDHLPLYDAYAAIWASDDVYYNGGGTTHASAYNAWHNEMAARIARLIGKDPAPYQREADAIRRAMRQQLWMPERGAFAEYRDLLGKQLLHPSYGLWSFYHTIDSKVPTAFEAARMAADLDTHLKAIPVGGPGVPADRPYHMLSESDWMPYAWSINNVVFGENLHTALAYWQAGRADTAFDITKGAVLASLYMGISPGNIGTLNYLDVYRREAQRDFADGVGIMSRTIIEGMFGVHPDALAGVLTLRPGLPAEWDHATLTHPDLTLSYRRNGKQDKWEVTQTGARFRHLVLELPARSAKVAQVRVDGKPVAWQSLAEAIGAPKLRIELPFSTQTRIEIAWRDVPLNAQLTGATEDGFNQVSQGDFSWWVADARAPKPEPTACTLSGPAWTNSGDAINAVPVDLKSWFNDSVTNIFKPGKYLSPRAPHVTLALPSQGIGAWAGHLNALPVIDDTGLRALGGILTLPNGLRFATPAGTGPNIVFTSQWDNYPHEVTIPLKGQAHRAFLLMAGSTNFMQSRIDNGEIIVSYTDGTQTRTALRNPDNWWPIEQDYFIDDYQFPLCGRLPVRVDLKTARVRVPDPATVKGAGRDVAGGAATVLELPLDSSRQLKTIILRTLANDVLIGLMGLTIDLGQ
ncbi:DUF4450 domain-containing protein [Duganella callida]|uniref:DUF4450 domain-containing protein n=1 Tax=Duganella callida TaxID=2561932 RepID=A0A4Y9SX11_9BURK|nr:DUF4450 domain-containing protein [Duganella callida]TFW31366.1 DUF4450 domain-containing protein [Duganella callida]